MRWFGIYIYVHQKYIECLIKVEKLNENIWYNVQTTKKKLLQ